MNPKASLMTKPQPALKFIFLTLVLDVLGFGLLIPVGPRLVEHLMGFDNGGPGAQEQSAPVVGWLMTTWFAMSFLFAPALGALSDHVGRRPVLLIAMLGSGIDFLAQGLSPNLAILFITRALNGISGASITVASAYVADVTPPERRAHGFGMLGAAFGIGFALGPALGGFLGSINIRLPFFVAGGLTLLNALYGLLVLPESLPVDRRAPFRWNRTNPLGTLGSIAHYPMVLGLAIALFLMKISEFMLHSVWALHSEYRYQWTPLGIGMSLCAVGIFTSLVQGGLARRIVARFGERRALLAGISIIVITYAGYGASVFGWMIYGVILLAAFGGIAGPASQSLITGSVRPDEQGAVQGAIASLQSIAGIIGPFIGGHVFSYFIEDDRVLKIPGAPFFVGSAIAALGGIVTLITLRRVPPVQHPPEPLGSAEV